MASIMAQSSGFSEHECVELLRAVMGNCPLPCMGFAIATRGGPDINVRGESSFIWLTPGHGGRQGIDYAKKAVQSELFIAEVVCRSAGPSCGHLFVPGGVSEGKESSRSLSSRTSFAIQLGRLAFARWEVVEISEESCPV
jgi:hypothetical protein